MAGLKDSPTAIDAVGFEEKAARRLTRVRVRQARELQAFAARPEAAIEVLLSHRGELARIYSEMGLFPADAPGRGQGGPRWRAEDLFQKGKQRQGESHGSF